MSRPAVSAADAVHALHRGGFREDLIWLDAAATPGQIIYEPIYFFLIRHPQATVLFDCGVAPARVASPAGTSSRGELDARPTDTAVAGLADLGVSADEVTHIVLSHLHWDHVGGLSQFPGAVATVQRTEWEFADGGAHGYITGEYAGHESWSLVDGEHDLLGDGTIRLFPTPGHTPGHQAAFVSLAGRPVILAGDAAGNLGLLREGRMPPAESAWNLETFEATWHMLAEMERESGAQLIGTHDLNSDVTVNRADDPYR